MDLPLGLTRDEVIAKFGAAPAHLKGSTGMVGLVCEPLARLIKALDPESK
jgi:hypothetical protein